MTKLDDNREQIAQAVTDDVSKTVSNLLVDPATDRLAIDINNVAPGSDTPSAKIDENYESVALVVEDDGGLAVVPLLCDANGYPIVDIVIE